MKLVNPFNPFKPAFEAHPCAVCGTNTVSTKDATCTTCAPVSTDDTAVAGKETITVDQLVAQSKALITKAITLTKGSESAMTTIKSTIQSVLNKGKEATTKVAPTVEAATTKGTSIFSSIKGAFTKAKDSKVATFIKKHTSAAVAFMGNKKAAIVVGTVSAIAGGLVTASACAAVAVGAVVASLVTLAAAYMGKKKEEAMDRKAMLTNLLVSVGTVAISPFVLLLAAYVGMLITIFGTILPYSIIVA